MANEQLSFEFKTPQQFDMFYFALRPDAVAAQAAMDVARRCCRRHELSGRPYGGNRLHVSLSPVMSPRGRRRDDVAAALRAAARVKAMPFPVTFDRICTFQRRSTRQERGTRPIVLCCDGGAAALTGLRDSLRRELVKAGLWRGPAAFQPHLTLLWDERPVPPSCLDEPIGWTVEDFVLVRSEFGRSRHVDLGRWPLET